jgi:hypothetical protein
MTRQDSTITIHTTASVNGGERLYPCVLELTQEVEYVRSLGAVRPDPNWRFIDRLGHEHSFAGDDLPTLTAHRVQMPCDGSCDGVCEGEGYSVTRYRCSICGEDVEPNWVPDYRAREVGTPITGITWWTVKIQTDRVLSGDVDLAMDLDGMSLTGKGTVGDQTVYFRHGGVAEAETLVIGVGPLVGPDRVYAG